VDFVHFDWHHVRCTRAGHCEAEASPQGLYRGVGPLLWGPKPENTISAGALGLLTT
jgi:hypothetical protein